MRYQWSKTDDELIKKGLSKERIAERLGVSESQVYSRMHYLATKKNGLSGLLLSKGLTVGQKAARTRKANQVVKEFKVPKLDKPYTSFKYTINGTIISIEGNAKEVFVSKDHIKVNY